MSEESNAPTGEQSPASEAQPKGFSQQDLDAAVAKAVEEATQGLKAKNAELLGETKAEREKRHALEKAQEEAEAERKQQAGEFKELYEKTLSELKAEREAHATTKGNVAKRDKEAATAAIANELTRDTGRAAILAEQAAKFAKHGDDGITYEIGGVTVEKAQVLDHLRNAYPFLVDGNQASGGGASGGSGGAATKKLADMTEAERRDMQATDPQRFRQMVDEARKR